MSDAITFVDKQLPAIPAWWLNKLGVMALTALGDGTNIPQTATQVKANLGIVIPPTPIDYSLPNGSSLVGTIRPEIGAAARTVLSKMDDTISVLDFGADPAGGSDSTAAISQALMAAAGKALVFPPGVYSVGGAGFTLTSGTTILGYGATLRRAAAPSSEFFKLTSGSNVHILGITFDDNNFVSSPTCAQVAIYDSNTTTIRDCQFVGWRNFGLSVGDSNQILVEGNYFKTPTAVNTVQMCINFFSNPGHAGPIYNTIRGNVLINAGMNVKMAYSLIADNFIANWKYGGGIVTEQDPKSSNMTISRNYCILGTGTDVDVTNCPGMELWSPYSTVTNNICLYNSGSGIDCGGKYSVLSGNVTVNNGVTAGGSGLGMRYGVGAGGVIYEGSYCTVANNISFDTDGASGTQSYGYEEQSSSVQYNQLSGNMFLGNKVGSQLIKSYTVSFTGPNVSYSQSFGAGIPSIAPGASAVYTITCVGARLGDFVQASYSLDLQGLVLTGWCHTADAVKVSLANATPGAISLAAGTMRVKATKPVDHGSY